MGKTIATQIIEDRTAIIDNEIAPKDEIGRLRLENEQLKGKVKKLEKALDLSNRDFGRIYRYRVAIMDILEILDELKNTPDP